MHKITIHPVISIEPRCEDCGEPLGAEFDEESYVLYVGACTTCIEDAEAAKSALTTPIKAGD